MVKNNCNSIYQQRYELHSSTGTIHLHDHFSRIAASYFTKSVQILTQIFLLWIQFVHCFVLHLSFCCPTSSTKTQLLIQCLCALQFLGTKPKWISSSLNSFPFTRSLWSDLLHDGTCCIRNKSSWACFSRNHDCSDAATEFQVFQFLIRLPLIMDDRARSRISPLPHSLPSLSAWVLISYMVSVSASKPEATKGSLDIWRGVHFWNTSTVRMAILMAELEGYSYGQIELTPFTKGAKDHHMLWTMEFLRIRLFCDWMIDHWSLFVVKAAYMAWE